jgi:signal transduction histidine kinase
MLPYAWRLAIGVARTLLAMSCLALFILFGKGPVPWGLAPLAAFLIYSAAALWRSTHASGEPLAILFIDAAALGVWIAFTAGAAYGGPLWFAASSAAYMFVLAIAVLNHQIMELATVVIALIAVIFAVPHPAAVALRPMILWGAAFSLVLAAYKQHLEARLSRAARQSVLFRYEGQRAREEERQRIAADFHDGPLQSFISFQMRLEILRKMLAKDVAAAMDELRQLQELCRAQVSELRAFVRSMRPADVDGAGLGASISRMVEQFQRDTGIAASFLSSDTVEPLETEVALELLQIVREALNNVHKHARATRVAVAMTKRGDSIEITVDDNGSGFPFSGCYTLDELDLLRLGPVSIRRRVRALGAEMQLESRPGQGAGLKVRVPVHSQAAADDRR